MSDFEAGLQDQAQPDTQADQQQAQPDQQAQPPAPPTQPAQPQQVTAMTEGTQPPVGAKEVADAAANSAQGQKTGMFKNILTRRLERAGKPRHSGRYRRQRFRPRRLVRNSSSAKI
jgi:hypothetical protein